jgi:hypothetical protein
MSLPPKRQLALILIHALRGKPKPTTTFKNVTTVYTTFMVRLHLTLKTQAVEVSALTSFSATRATPAMRATNVETLLISVLLKQKQMIPI